MACPTIFVFERSFVDMGPLLRRTVIPFPYLDTH